MSLSFRSVTHSHTYTLIHILLWFCSEEPCFFPKEGNIIAKRGPVSPQRLAMMPRTFLSDSRAPKGRRHKLLHCPWGLSWVVSTLVAHGNHLGSLKNAKAWIISLRSWFKYLGCSMNTGMFLIPKVILWQPKLKMMTWLSLVRLGKHLCGAREQVGKDCLPHQVLSIYSWVFKCGHLGPLSIAPWNRDEAANQLVRGTWVIHSGYWTACFVKMRSKLRFLQGEIVV